MITIRRISADQAPVLRTVRLAALADTPDAFSSTLERELAFDDSEWGTRATLAAAGHERCTFFAWHDDGRVVGIVGGYRHHPAARASDGSVEGAGEAASDEAVVDLVSMWTDPSVRRSGTGRRLIDAVVDWARTAAVSRVELWVMRGNDPAQRLYESAGFVVTGDHQPFPSDPCRDEIRMVLSIS